jgi:hypothetical protein
MRLLCSLDGTICTVSRSDLHRIPLFDLLFKETVVADAMAEDAPLPIKVTAMGLRLALAVTSRKKYPYSSAMKHHVREYGALGITMQFRFLMLNEHLVEDAVMEMSAEETAEETHKLRVLKAVARRREYAMQRMWEVEQEMYRPPGFRSWFAHLFDGKGVRPDGWISRVHAAALYAGRGDGREILYYGLYHGSIGSTCAGSSATKRRLDAEAKSYSVLINYNIKACKMKVEAPRNM